MVQIRHIVTLLPDNGPFRTNIADLSVVQVGTGLVLVASTAQGGGLSSYRITNSDTAIQAVDTRAYVGAISHLADPELLVLDGAQPRVMPIGLGAAPGFGLTLLDSGHFGNRSGLQNSGLPAQTVAAEAFSIGGKDYLVANSRGELGFTLYQMGANNSLTKIGNSLLNTSSAFADAAISDFHITHIGGQVQIFAVSALGNFISSHTVRADGKITGGQFLGVAEGAGFNQPTALTAVHVAGRDFLVVSSGSSSSLTVVLIRPDGSMTPIDHVIDEETTRFRGATALDSVMLDGRAFIFVGGSDGGITLFTLMPDGRLLWLANIVDTDQTSLAGVSALDAQVIDGKIVLFATSQSEGGISQFSIDPGPIGLTQTVGSGVQHGSSGGDLMVAGDGTTRLFGGDGDDILIAGTASVSMTGGAGADIFVPVPIKGRIAILDFQLGTDRLDLSKLGMIRSTYQLVFSPQSYGIKIFYGETVIDIYSADRTMLLPSMFTNEMFPHTHYDPGAFPVTIISGGGNDTLVAPGKTGAEIIGGDGHDLIIGTPDRDTLMGWGGNDTIIGNGSADLIFGHTGNDRLLGGDGDDTLDGGWGDDFVSGDEGHDLLIGQTGNDTIYGGAGNDSILAGAGNDVLHGGPGDDTIYGQDGHDIIYGNDGDDVLIDRSGQSRVWGGAGNDLIITGALNDLIFGETGNDTIKAGAGDDIILGGAGDDQIRAGPGHDFIRGDDGDDTIWGEAGNDKIHGGRGNDNISGGGGHDKIKGEDGNDTIHGRSGNDTLNGGAGNDRIFGGTGDDRIFGMTGNDTIWGGDGADLILTGPGNNIVLAGHGDDNVFGHSGDEFLSGEGGNDTLRGRGGHDTIRGGKGDDRLFGDAGNDKVSGGEGNDFLFGGAGHDTLSGGDGNDRLDGGAGADKLWGGNGRDTLIGGSGGDTMAGGAGADMFVFTTRIDSTLGAPDRIIDFEQGIDRLDLRALALTTNPADPFAAGGPLSYQATSYGLRLLIDSDGDSRPDMQIDLVGLNHLTAADLML